MTITMWLIVFGILAAVSLISFLHFFIKDSRLRAETGAKATILLVDSGLLFITFASVGAAVMLYLDWQEQINYFLTL